MLDSANYNTGPVAITKAVTILAIPGALGSVVALGDNAMNINTTGAVTLRNLNILPFPGNANQMGVISHNGAIVGISDALFTGNTLFGVTVMASAANSASASVTRPVARGNQYAFMIEGGEAGSTMNLAVAASHIECSTPTPSGTTARTSTGR